MDEETPGRACAREAGLQIIMSDVTGRTPEGAWGCKGGWVQFPV